MLGDVERIVAIDADGEAERGRIRLDPDHMGSIHSPKVAIEVRELLEGGQAAFEDLGCVMDSEQSMNED